MNEGTDNHYSLREANLARQAVWQADSGAKPTLAYAGNELAGEVGEAVTEVLKLTAETMRLFEAVGNASNVIKKLERERLGWRGSRSSVEALANELADVIICVDLVAILAGIDMDEAVSAKFNSTSEKLNLPTRLHL